MRGLVCAGIFPHPPIIIEEIGKSETLRAQRTIKGATECARLIAEKQPDTLIVITPHGPLFKEALSINVEKMLRGDFVHFGHPELKYEFKNDLSLANALCVEATNSLIPLIALDNINTKKYEAPLDLDWGVLVPLYFIAKQLPSFKVVPLTYSYIPNPKLYSFGTTLATVIERESGKGKRVAVIASGDLSHKLKEDGPYGFHPSGPVFDKKIVEIITQEDWPSLVSFDARLANEAGECGLRSLIILAGILSHYKNKVNTRVHSYEGPFGVGYLTSFIDIGGQTPKTKKTDKKSDSSIDDRADPRADSRADGSADPYIALAIKSLEAYVRHRLVIQRDIPEELEKQNAGCFVSLHKDGLLRGCIGTIFPVEKNLGLEIIHNVISAGSKDPRFPPVTPEELESLDYSVDILTSPERAEIKDLNPKIYGIIVSSGFKKGLLLPDLEGVETITDQLRIAKLKAGIGEHESYALERFQVVRHVQKPLKKKEV